VLFSVAVLDCGVTGDTDTDVDPGPIRVDHVGIAVESVAAAAPVLQALGCERLLDETVEGRFRWVYYRLGDASRIELVEPVAEDTFLTDFLDRNGPGLHHVTLEVADIDVAVAAAEAAGLDVVDRTTFEDWHEAFVSPTNPTGTLFQFIEHRAGYAEDRAPPAELFVNGERLGARPVDDDDGTGTPAGDDGVETGEAVDPAVVERIAADPFCARLGVDLVALETDRARTRLRVTPGLANFHDTVHGAAVYALADAAFAAASNADGGTALALETDVSYLEAVDPHDGGWLTADAERTHDGGRTAAYRVRVRHRADAPTTAAPDADDGEPTDGRLVATFHGRVYRP